ncbi:MAG: SGNH/GDSL hydrolase family protein [Caldilineaceae bacterium]
MFDRVQRPAAFLLFVILLVLANWIVVPTTGHANADPGAAYIALGDSIDVGVGATDDEGYVAQLNSYLPEYLGLDVVELINLAQSGATVRAIEQEQLEPALAAIEQHEGADIVISWGGGGNDLLQFILSPGAVACRRQSSCLKRLNTLLNAVEQTADDSVRALRAAAGPNAIILMRTQYNSLAKLDYPILERIRLADIALEGLPDSPLEEGLNDRLRAIADRYDAKVVDLYLPFRADPDALIADDFIHPNDAGHAQILELAIDALNAG